MHKCTLTLIRGLPGSGKSTYAKSLNVLHLEDDHFCMQGGEYKWSKDTRLLHRDHLFSLTSHSMMFDMDVVVAGVFVRKAEIEKYKKLAVSYFFRFKVIRILGVYGKDIHNVNPFHIEKMKAYWEDYPSEISM